MSSCKLVIKDEVNVKFENLSLEWRKRLSNKFKYEIPYARHLPAVKLGRWDGKVSFFGLGGTTYLNLVDQILPILEEGGVYVDYEDNYKRMLKDFFDEFSEMYTKAGFTNIKTNDNGRIPGNDIHEMGGARMGHDPKTSLLNKWNQIHHCSNVFVTDGACMTSTSTQNPSLTFMALTARAANYAIEEIKKGNI